MAYTARRNLNRAVLRKGLIMRFGRPKRIFGFAGAIALSAASLGLEVLVPASGEDRIELPPAPVVTLEPGSFTHPMPGEFLKQGHPATAPRALVEIGKPLEIMTYQVSLNDYGQCVDDGACEPADAHRKGNLP